VKSEPSVSSLNYKVTPTASSLVTLRPNSYIEFFGQIRTPSTQSYEFNALNITITGLYY
jgi:hypothetical protein